MLMSEFILLTGFEPTTEEFNEIENEYYGMPDQYDKNDFCKEWVKNGGFKRLMRCRAAEIDNLKNEIRLLKANLTNTNNIIAQLRQENKELSKENEELIAENTVLEEKVYDFQTWVSSAAYDLAKFVPNNGGKENEND